MASMKRTASQASLLSERSDKSVQPEVTDPAAPDGDRRDGDAGDMDDYGEVALAPVSHTVIQKGTRDKVQKACAVVSAAHAQQRTI